MIQSQAAIAYIKKNTILLLFISSIKHETRTTAKATIRKKLGQAKFIYAPSKELSLYLDIDSRWVCRMFTRIFKSWRLNCRGILLSSYKRLLVQILLPYKLPSSNRKKYTHLHRVKFGKYSFREHKLTQLPETLKQCFDLLNVVTAQKQTLKHKDYNRLRITWKNLAVAKDKVLEHEVTKR